jgi:hypothetical protein
MGLASARRITGAEWKRMPMVKPLASDWWVGFAVSTVSLG